MKNSLARVTSSTLARQRFTLRQIEAFATTARLGSVSEAAVHLARTRSAISMALGELESAHRPPLARS